MGEGPSDRDIADAVLFLYDGEERPENIEIARLASRMPCPGIGEVETVTEDPEVLRFEGELAHQRFLNWIDQYRTRGYVVNLWQGSHNSILHAAGCSHLRPSPNVDQEITARPKLCSTDLQAVRREAANFGGRLEHCAHCDI